MKRCDWVGSHPLEIRYHDEEWGQPVHDDNKLFEFLVLESAQAGLSWLTILKRREQYRKAYEQFDPAKVVDFDDLKVNELLKNEGIIRNRKKIESSINNARRFLEIQSEFGSFNNYLWQFVDFKPIKNKWKNCTDIPSSTNLSDKIAKDMKKRGFKFIGSTIIYAFLQAVGVVHDHTIDCFKYIH